jgi:uncharacterized protein YbjT (DUF2867 family)
MILLTGATGSAGSFVASEFVKQRQPVRILVRDRAKAKSFERIPTVEIVEGDMADEDSLGRALDGVERTLMISSPDVAMAETQSRFIDASKAAGVRHIIKFSGLDARPETSFVFGRMHLEIESYLEGSGLAWTHLRPTGFMQEYLREAPTIIKEGALYLALADAKLNPVDLADVGKAGFRLLRDGGHAGERLIMTGPEALTMTEVADRISTAIGKPVRYTSVPREIRRQALVANGVPSEMADALDVQAKERVAGGPESRVDLSTHRMFGIKPTTFLEFARRHADAFGGGSSKAAASRSV